MSIARTAQSGELANITVVTAAGKKYDLGKPTDRLHKFRIWRYKRSEGIKIDANGVPYSTKRGVR